MTPREIQVVTLVCEGLTNDEIGKALKIRLSTVKTHLHNVYRRALVKNRILLLIKFMESINSASSS